LRSERANKRTHMMKKHWLGTKLFFILKLMLIASSRAFYRYQKCNKEPHGARGLIVGKSEPTTTNAPVGCSTHWMGCIFSFDIKWGSSQSISFHCWPLYFIFGGLFLVGPNLTHNYPIHLPTFISIVPTLVPY
jgi:hypothetical protein